MGRKPNQLISSNFKRGPKLENSSNRYEQTCVHCARSFPKGRPEVLTSHLSKCPALSPGTRINILNQPDHAAFPDRSDLDQNYSQQHNVGLQQLADVAEAAGAATIRQSLQQDHSIPLDPQLSAPPHQNGASVIVPQFGDHSYYAPAASYGPGDLEGQTSSSASMYPSLTGPPITTEGSQYPPFAGLPMPPFQNPFGQYSAPEQIPTTSVSSFAPVGAGTDFDAFVPPANDNISQPSPLGSLDPSFAQQQNKPRSRHSASPKRSVSKPRKPKEPYSADQRKKISDMRKRKPCIRCSRLQKSCSVQKPCVECLKVQTSKNWIGPCTKFRNSGEFDVWFQQQLSSDQFNVLSQQVNSTFVRDDNAMYMAEVQIAELESAPIVFEVSRTADPNGQDIIWLPNDNFDLQNAILSYLRANTPNIIQTIDQAEIAITLERAHALTNGKKVPLSKVVLGQQLEGDQNMRQLIDLWLAVYLLSTSPWTITVRDVSGNIHQTEGPDPTSCIKLKLESCLESIISGSRIGPLPIREDGDEPEYSGAIYHFDVTRLSSSSHKEFHNLLIGIILVLSAVERYCAFTRDRTGDLPGEYREKAEEYARKYVYAVRGVSILPSLSLQEDNAGGRVVYVKHAIVETGGNQKPRPINYTLTKSFLERLHLNPEELQVKSVSVDEAWTGDTAAWNGWLWSRIFLAMLE